MYFQLDIESHWWLLSGSTLNVSLSPCRPILVAPFLSPSSTAYVCAFVRVREEVCVCVFRCLVCATEKRTHAHAVPANTSPPFSTDWQRQWSSTDTITQVHTGGNAIIVAAGNGKRGLPASQPPTHTHTKPVLWTQLPDVIQALSSNQMNPTGP